MVSNTLASDEYIGKQGKPKEHFSVWVLQCHKGAFMAHHPGFTAI
jgi:hypothetical protein